MYKEINEGDFHSWFSQSGTYKNKFSYNGLNALFEYLEEYEESTGEQIQFDPIALCCEYSEYESATEAYIDYNTGTLDIAGDDEEMEQQALNWLEDRTQVITFDGGIIISQF